MAGPTSVVEDCGDKSLRECRDATALIVFGMDEVINKKTQSIELAMANEMPIVLVENECVNCEAASIKVHPIIGDYQNIIAIKKTTIDLFDRENKHLIELTEYLDSKGVDNLIIEGPKNGADVDVSIRLSIEGALKNEYDVYAVSGREQNLNSIDSILKKCKYCSFKNFEDIQSLQLSVNMSPGKAIIRKHAGEVDASHPNLIDNMLKGIEIILYGREKVKN